MVIMVIMVIVMIMVMVIKVMDVTDLWSVNVIKISNDSMQWVLWWFCGFCPPGSPLGSEALAKVLLALPRWEFFTKTKNLWNSSFFPPKTCQLSKQLLLFTYTQWVLLILLSKDLSIYQTGISSATPSSGSSTRAGRTFFQKVILATAFKKALDNC